MGCRVNEKTIVPVWVMDNCNGFPKRHYATLLALSRYAHNETWSCYPSVQNIAKRAQLSRTYTTMALSQLQAAGVITKRRRRRDSTEYTINRTADLEEAAEALANEIIFEAYDKQQKAQAKTSSTAVHQETTKTSSAAGHQSKLRLPAPQVKTASGATVKTASAAVRELSFNSQVMNSKKTTPFRPPEGDSSGAETPERSEEENLLIGLEADLSHLRAICRGIGLEVKNATPKLRRALAKELRARIEKNQKMAEQEVHQFIFAFVGKPKAGAA